MPEIILKGDFAAKKLFFARKLRAAEGGRTAAAGGGSSAEVALFRHKKTSRFFRAQTKGRQTKAKRFFCNLHLRPLHRGQFLAQQA